MDQETRLKNQMEKYKRIKINDLIKVPHGNDWVRAKVIDKHISAIGKPYIIIEGYFSGRKESGLSYFMDQIIF